ncbi:hypothetical protein FNU79_14050 [Deinococcus detaillensis]|uniref:Uncharacterized protein n=1 Tax=Deinococcus detaillensis TaxID=2592048 RepID=A0A553UPK9_9DEIO|nr:hypothetical protein FNU79_14050 [Deinococcus detaillensis]
MKEDWYKLLRSAHYLGYHTQPAMSYHFDQAQDFSLVTSNAGEVKEAQELLKRGTGMEAAIGTACPWRNGVLPAGSVPPHLNCPGESR